MAHLQGSVEATDRRCREQVAHVDGVTEVLTPEEQQPSRPFGSLPGDSLRDLAADLLQKAALRARHRLPVASAVGLAQHLLARAERADAGEAP